MYCQWFLELVLLHCIIRPQYRLFVHWIRDTLAMAAVMAEYDSCV